MPGRSAQVFRRKKPRYACRQNIARKMGLCRLHRDVTPGTCQAANSGRDYNSIDTSKYGTHQRKALRSAFPALIYYHTRKTKTSRYENEEDTAGRQPMRKMTLRTHGCCTGCMTAPGKGHPAARSWQSLEQLAVHLSNLGHGSPVRTDYNTANVISTVAMTWAKWIS